MNGNITLLLLLCTASLFAVKFATKPAAVGQDIRTQKVNEVETKRRILGSEASMHKSHSRKQLALPAGTTTTKINILPAAGNNQDGSWSCPIREDHFSHRHTPVVVFAQHRTGSNLFFDMLARLGRSSVDNVHLLPLFELFVADAMGFKRIATSMAKDCDADGMTQEAKEEWSTQISQIAKPFAKLPTIQNMTLTEWHKELYRVIENANPHPAGLLRFLNGIPSLSKQAFFTFKIFKDQLGRLEVSTEDFVRSIASLSSPRKPKFIVLWRRNFLESYVSLIVAQQFGTWVRTNTDEKQAVTIKKEEFVRYIEEQTSYYESVRDALLAGNVEFEVFEYDRDLIDRNKQLETMKRTVNILELSDTPEHAEILVDQIQRKKQAQVPVEKQVLNWQEVTEWGFTGKPEDFGDIFA